MDSVHYISGVVKVSDKAVRQVRAFNRRWTEVMELLDSEFLRTKYSLTEARVLFELAQVSVWDRSELRVRLGLDDSYFTRLLNGFERDGLVTAQPSPVDGRRKSVSLTASGRDEFARLDERSSAQINELLSPLTAAEQQLVLESMGIVAEATAPGSPRTVRLRPLRSGDLGWVVKRHGEVYSAEYGWNYEFEGMVAKIVGDYTQFDQPRLQNGWIAEVNGVRAGSIFCCRKSDTEALLRVLLVEPWARGTGIGRKLVRRCISFAESAGYETMSLWTVAGLDAARSLYESEGFELVDEQPDLAFGKEIVAQTWRRALHAER